MQANLSAQDQATLLALAYDAIASAIRDSPPPPVELKSLSNALREMRATFVTLTLDGNLRGCIGTVEKCYPLAQDVVLRAAAAATRDPRFPSIRSDELDKLHIEVSILSDPFPVQYEDPMNLPHYLENEPLGVILRYGKKRATFLPQVWERVTNGEQFLGLLCRKAQLPDDFWQSGQLQFETYSVESFHR
jgi:AmmeMemoRadiSam system protein A